MYTKMMARFATPGMPALSTPTSRPVSVNSCSGDKERDMDTGIKGRNREREG